MTDHALIAEIIRELDPVGGWFELRAIGILASLPVEYMQRMRSMVPEQQYRQAVSGAVRAILELHGLARAEELTP